MTKKRLVLVKCREQVTVRTIVSCHQAQFAENYTLVISSGCTAQIFVQNKTATRGAIGRKGYRLSDWPRLHDIPQIFQRATELRMCEFHELTKWKLQAHLATRDRSAQWVIAYADFFVDNTVRKVITSSCHRTDEDGNRAIMWNFGEMICKFHGWCISGEGCMVSKSVTGRAGASSTYRFCVCSLGGNPRPGSEHHQPGTHARLRRILTLMTLSSFSGPFTARIESFCSS